MASEQNADTASSDETKPEATSNLSQMQDVRVTVSMELGRAEMTLDEILQVGEQSLIELQKGYGEPVDILLNGKLFARGEVVTVQENFGVRVTEIVGREQEDK